MLEYLGEKKTFEANMKMIEAIREAVKLFLNNMMNL